MHKISNILHVIDLLYKRFSLFNSFLKMLNIYCSGTCEYSLLCFDQNVLENCKNLKKNQIYMKKLLPSSKIIHILDKNLSHNLSSIFLAFPDMAYY